MIVFDLSCSSDHVLEAWFGSSQDFEDQKAKGLVTCPVCGSADVRKAVMAPAVGAKGNRAPAPGSLQRERLAALRDEVEASCDYVGRRFVEEARARALAPPVPGPQRGLMGEASLAEAAELIDEGIAVLPLPFRPRQAADA